MPFEAIFQRALSLGVERAAHVRFDAGEPEQLMLLALYGSVIDISHSMKVLVEQRVASGVPILLRSLLERG